MSYLQLEKGIPDFTKAVISLWFRVPKQSLIDVANDDKDERLKAEGDFYVYPRMMGILPLLTFGPLKEGYQIKTDAGDQAYTRTIMSFGGCAYHTIATNELTTATGPVYSEVSEFLANPSFIGVRSVWKDDVIDASLVVRLQMTDNGSGSSLRLAPEFSINDHVQLATVSWSPEDGCASPPIETAYDYGIGECITNEVYPGGAQQRHTEYRDETELFTRANGPEEFEAGNGIDITPDRWHHALISFDLDHAMKGQGIKAMATYPGCAEGDAAVPVPEISGESIKAVTNPCQMWIALDDVNLTGNQVFNNYADVAGLGSNGIVSRNVYDAATAVHSAVAYQKTWFLTGLIDIVTSDTSHSVPTYSYKPKPIPSKGFPLGVPCTSALVDYVHHVEMAELQIFTGVTLDTSKQDKRRAFISEKGKPVGSSQAENLLEKKPVVLLHKSGNWISGKNTGALGIAADGKPIPADQFDPTGGIERYKPDPSLHGKQGSP